MAFTANLDAGGSGIFAALPGGAGPFAILQTGDSLLGSTVTGVSFGVGGLNDSNSLAFRYSLADGRSGIATANITAVAAPEPGTLALVACGLIAGAGLVVKRRHVVA